jgi:hypothetical protein
MALASEPLLMDEIDALLDDLCAAAIDDDREAAAFLQMFAPWAEAHGQRISSNPSGLVRKSDLTSF